MNCVVPGGGMKLFSGAGDGDGDCISTVLAGVGTATLAFSLCRSGVRSAVIWSNRGLTTKKNTPASAPPPRSKNTRMPAMIHGSFDFFFATGGGNGAEGAGNGADGTTGGACGAAGVLISPVVTRGGGAAEGVTAGGGGGVAGGVGLPMSDGFAPPAGAVVGPVLRGSATVAG